MRKSLNIDEHLDVDATMDSLDFGLFTQRPRLGDLLRQSMPVVWISLVSVWPVLLSAFLRLLWCVAIPFDGSDGERQVTERLLPSPDTVCWTGNHNPIAMLAIAGLVIWCLGIPVALVLRVLSLADRHSPDNYRKYGYFMQAATVDACLLPETREPQRRTAQRIALLSR